MIGSVRASVPRVIPRNATGFARTLITKSERWTPATAREGKLLEQNAAVELDKVLPNIESHWTKLSNEQQYSVYKQLEEVQRKDWKDLSINEQKGAYFIAYGPYGPRKTVTPNGQIGRVILGSAVAVSVGLVMFYTLRSTGTFGYAHPAPEQPKTMTKEYQEEMNKRAKELGLNPINGISSPGYKGEGFVAK